MNLHGLTMLTVLAGSLLLGSNVSGVAQSLQPPPQPAPPAPVPPVVAAPNQPVHRQPDHHGGTTAKAVTPVVAAHGPSHAHKPAATDAAGKPAEVKPPPAVSAGPPPQGAPTQADTAVTPDKQPEPEKPDGTTAKLPRFASLRSDDVNMRVGPGPRYRIDWVYKRRDLPVEIEREFDVWRWVRDPDGNHGWVHQATLMGRRSFIVQAGDATLRSDPSETSAAVAILKSGVIGRIRSCEATSEWCNVQTGSYRGYLRRSQIWGVLPFESVGP